jgi:ribosomal protein S18 acetylase RimI-like enzyme
MSPVRKTLPDLILLGSLVLSSALPVLSYGEGGRPRITVVPVTSEASVRSLADLRYDEWMCEDGHREDGSGGAAAGRPPPSRHAFRMATAEVVAERTEGGATAYLALMEVGGGGMEGGRAPQQPITVGTAELSPVEFEGVVEAASGSDAGQVLYVTDVVTSSRHRRMGVANALMDRLEADAIPAGSRSLFLHVERDNTGAMGFYTSPRRGYEVASRAQLRGIDIDALNMNAGTEGQILLCKELPRSGKEQTPLGILVPEQAVAWRERLLCGADEGAVRHRLLSID